MDNFDYGNIDIDKTHYLAFSGGTDSSLYLQKLCKVLNREKKEPIAIICRPSYIGTKKLISEAKSREKLEENLIAMGHSFSKVTVKVDLEFDTAYSHDGISGLPQPPLWVLQCLPLMKDNSVLHLGYINGDHFWYYDTHLISMVESYCKFVNKNIELQFGLRMYTKSEVIQELQDNGLYDYTWWCETPYKVGEPCQICHSCTTHNTAVLEKYINEGNIDKVMDLVKMHKDLKNASELGTESDCQGDSIIIS